ncbi:hypothetical protein llap_21394 [Limosa lapponica baueri]|uniref:Heat shock 70 kDa protein 12a n=1 Tax=Limosa lapponica baueri TaxID=1758121 RepID=A0A2I0T3E6_LIMLA|nr:hypothetical protein llap_21394 [Limosa lapponica baueri]
MIAFESRKRAAAPDRTNPLNITLPFSFIDYYKKFRGDVFDKPEVTNVKFLFLVGGFAESPLLQQAVQSAFGSRCRVIIPQDVGLTILKGAVLFGLDPAVIKVRRSPLTYGVGVLNRFVEGKHPPEKLLVKDGTRWCTDVFDKFISADQSVALGETVTRSYTPAKPSQLVIVINIYSSEQDNVSFITEAGVKKCGTLRLDLTGTDASVPNRREIKTLMQFGDTEIKAMAIDVATSKSVKVGIDFLNY